VFVTIHPDVFSRGLEDLVGERDSHHRTRRIIAIDAGTYAMDDELPPRIAPEIQTRRRCKQEALICENVRM
jgi:hypothetical protein